MYSLMGMTQLLWPWGMVLPIFWLWMLFDCIKNEPDRGLWLWIMIILNFPGAFLYFIIRKLPQYRFQDMPFLKKWTNRHLLQQAEYNTCNIGNAAQNINLGELLLENKDYRKAKTAFDKALEKDPHDLQALWGASLVEYELKLFPAAKEKLEEIIRREQKFKFGEGSMALGRVLHAMKDYAGAKAHLIQHLQRHGSSEARVILAEILKVEGQKAEARKHLEIVLEDARGLPAFHKVRNRHWINKAKRMLWKL